MDYDLVVVNQETEWTEPELSQFDLDNRQGFVVFMNSASGGNYTFQSLALVDEYLRPWPLI